MFGKNSIPLKNIVIFIVLFWTCGVFLSWLHSPVNGQAHNFSLTFNNMMDHMLHGRFDVDPDIVAGEGFLRDGRVYAYWGIVPALLRLPVLALPNGMNVDVTNISCMTALIIMLSINYKTLVYLIPHLPKNTQWIQACLFVAMTCSGAQICFLRFSLFQEVCFWAIVFGLLFVHWAVRACLNPAQAPKALTWMSVSAGLALLTRVSMGIALYAALALFGLLSIWRGIAMVRTARRGGDGQAAPKVLGHCLAAIAILLFFVGVTAWVNEQRWGNPFTFANYNLYIMNKYFPDRLPRTEAHGLFNFRRIPLGIIYYFIPVWVFKSGQGGLILQDSFHRLVDATEMPPSSFFLTDGFLLLLCSVFLVVLVKNHENTGMDKAASLLIILGLCTAPLLMLMAISMNFRYRAEFYPLFMFMGLMGSTVVSRRYAHNLYFRYLCIFLVCVSVVSSYTVMLLYKKSAFGPPVQLLTQSVWEYYKN